ncbi:MAG: choline kinase [Candidatus Poriferisodalaceae bacterium]|jgi:choline kinase
MTYPKDSPTRPKAIILAAGVGSRIRPLTDNLPKTLLPIVDIPILGRMLTNIGACGIEHIVVVLGYLHDQIEVFIREQFPKLDVSYVVNDRYEDTNTGYSLMLAEAAVDGSSFVKFDGDVVFDVEILRQLLAAPPGNHLCIDRNIQLDAEEVKVALSTGTRVALVSKTLAPSDAIGESIGIERIDAVTAKRLFAALREMMADESNLQEYYEGAYERLIADGVPFDALDITGLAWTEIDTHDDFATATRTFSS